MEYDLEGYHNRFKLLIKLLHLKSHGQPARKLQIGKLSPFAFYTSLEDPDRLRAATIQIVGVCALTI